MSKALRVALPVLLAGVLCIGLGTTSARASCQAQGGYPILQGLGTIDNGFIGGGSYDPATCGSDPDRNFWAVGLGNPTNGLGVDSGINPGIFYDPLTGGGFAITSDWGNPGTDGCIMDAVNFQADGTQRPNAVLVSNGFGEGTAAHSATYSALSVDTDNFFGAYNLDYAHAVTEFACDTVPVPVIGIVSGSGPFSVPLSWGGVSSLDDCGTNPAIGAGDCSGGARPLHIGWKVYSKSAPCTVGTLTGTRSSWTQEGGVLAAGANAGSTVAISAAAAGQCQFVAISPVWDSGFEGKFISGQAGPIGGSGNADGDAFSDLTDTCPNTSSADNSDTDGDGVGNVCDNCPSNANADQADADHDGVGDVCAACPAGTNDSDGDLVCSDTDNCPSTYNPSQADGDADGLGDACDVCPTDPTNDADGDGICGQSDDCPNNPDPAQVDTDHDGTGDACDACPYEVLNDFDGDHVCACDVGLFNDDVCPGGAAAMGTIYDNCPKIPNPNQAPSGFGDGLGAVCDEKFISAGLTPGQDQGFGVCLIKWRTSAEWNCPSYSVIYRSASGDKDTGVGANCTNCTRGVRNANYGGASGLLIPICHGGHDMFVLANRVVSPGGSCSAVKNYKTVEGRPVFQPAPRVR